MSGNKGSKLKRQGKATAQAREFVKGQIWRTPDAYVLITEVGKLLIHYRLGSRPETSTSPPRISAKHEVEAYLERKGGVLFKKAE